MLSHRLLRRAPQSNIHYQARLLSTFYDSQSGRMVTVPGSSGIRVHVSNWLAPGRPLGLTSLSCATAAQAALLRQQHTGLQTFVPFHQPADMKAAAEQGVGLELSAACGSAKALGDAVKAAQAARVPLRVVLEGCFDVRAGSDPDKNTLQAALEADVARLAELDVSTVILSDCRALATEEALRVAVEESFYMDVAGETVRERLGLRLSGPRRLELLAYALSLSITRVDCAQADLSSFLQVLPPKALT